MANNDTIPAARFYAKPAKRPRSPSPKAPEPPQSHTIPVANRSNSQAIHTSGHHFRKEVYVQAAEEMQGKYSMISVDTLLDYLPDKTGMPDPAYDTLKEVAQKTNETEMYEPFILAMTPYIAKEWTFINTSNHFDQTSPAAKYFTGSDIKPDIGLYSSIREGKPFTDSSEAELFGEFKLSPLDDPFPCKESAAARDTRGQIALYINAIQSTQERTRVFSFLIVANMCRLFCHSRAGTEYTKAFDHTKKSFLHQFFWRLSHAKKASFQGHDTTLKRASTRMNPDAAAARKALQLSLDAPLYTVTVADKIFYVSRPFTFAHLFPVGRGTRCYSAYDPVEERVVIIKDTWRDLAYEPEHKVYEKLHSYKVRYIPQVVAAADVNGIFQMTSLVNGQRLSHYRLVLDIVGTPLTEFESTHHLCKAVFCALQAHKDACEKARILHRDISAGNIIISDGNGYLIDWERSKDRDSTEARSKERTGTWQFMSIRIVEDPLTDHDVRDDIESFVYVLLHTAARHAPNSMKPSDRAYFLSLFDYHAAAGASKKMIVNQRYLGLQLVTAPFSDVLADLFTTVGYLYQSEDSLRAEAKHYAKKGEIDQTVGEWKRRMLTHDWIEDFLDESLQDPDWEAVTDRAVKHELLELAEDGRPSKKAKHEFTEYLTNVQDQRVSENT